MVITSLNNDKVKELVKLKDKKYRDKKKLYLVEGEHLVLEAYKNNVLKEVLLYDFDIKFSILCYRFVTIFTPVFGMIIP